MTKTARVIVVMLRQPWMNKPTERRSDPFWEFGSFGTTGCHQRNLLHPKNAEWLRGARLAFVQGGKQGSRLVYLTPPVEVTPYADRCEVQWPAQGMPMKYDAAPLVVDYDGNTDLPGLRELVASCKRNGFMGKFASKFRTRTEPLPEPVADELVRTYSRVRRNAARRQGISTSYEQALPCLPPLVDRTRKQTYRGLLASLR